MAYTIEHRVVIAGGHLRQPIVLTDVQKGEDGIEFFRLQKTESWAARLLVGKCDSRNERVLAKTDIIEYFIEERDNRLQALSTPAGAEAPQESLGHDDRQPQWKRVKIDPELLKDGAYVEIWPKEIAGVEHPKEHFKVLAGLPRSSLYIELRPSVLEWLHNAAVAQRASGEIHNQHPRAAAGAKAIVFKEDRLHYSYSREAVVARWKGPDGKETRKVFSCKTVTLDSAKGSALDWLAALDRIQVKSEAAVEVGEEEVKHEPPSSPGAAVDESASGASLSSVPSLQTPSSQADTLSR